MLWCSAMEQCSRAVHAVVSCRGVQWSSDVQCNGAGMCNGAVMCSDVQWSSVVVEQRVPCGAVECRSCSGVEPWSTVEQWMHGSTV